MPTQLLIASSDDANMRYASGLNIPDPFIWIRSGDGKRAKEIIVVSVLEYGRARQSAPLGTKVLLLDKIDLKNVRKPVGRNRNLADYAASLLLSHNLTEIVMPDNAWAAHVETLREHGLRVKLLSPFLPSRVIKNPSEIAAIKRTGLVTKKAMRRATEILRAATIDWNDTLLYEGKRLTSEFVKTEIEKIFLEHGCESGQSIVACGEDATQPHNRGSGLLTAGEPIVIDIFPRDTSSGYYFDMTRTFIKGTPREETRALYEAVRKAQLAGLTAIRPGRKACEVNAACQQVFTRLGYTTTDSEGFIHSTGHGLGLAIHEPPSVGARSDEVLRPGMVITVEPGLYYREIGGIRIEDTVLVTTRGCANLTNFPKVFTIK